MGQQVMIFFFVLFAFTVIAVDIDLDIPHALRENDECIDEKDSNNGLGGSCASYALQRSSRVKSSLTTDSSAAAPKESEGAQTDHPDEVEIAEAESAKNKEMLKAAEDEEKSDFSSKESLDHEASLNSGASLDPSMSDEPLRDDFSSTANISEEELGGAGPMCAETCWAKYGFVKGDCFCSRHRTWYMWVCSKLKGKRIKTQYGKQYSCSGLIGSGAQCTAKYSHNCMDRRECCDPGFSCYKKSDNWGSCLKTCTPGIHSNEPLKYRTPWSCEVLPTTTTTTTTPPHSPYNISDEDFPCCANNDMTTLPGALFYLHNEIIWHPKKRSGTFFSIPKTRIVRYKVQTRATQPLYDLGMDFGVMNAFDITQCTGPYKCENFERFGYTPGCENWIKGSPANFPHEQWDDINKYPGAEWFSLPGPCPLAKLKEKSAECKATQPGGECPEGITPTGTGDCTYTVKEAGQVKIDEIENIVGYDSFIQAGGREYDPVTDQGVHMNFWDGKSDEILCQQRVNITHWLFDRKYPDDPHIDAPSCNFNKYKFYAKR